MVHGPSLTPAMMRTRYHEAPVLLGGRELRGRPVRDGTRVMDEGGDAFAAWLGHVDAGRIGVR